MFRQGFRRCAVNRVSGAFLVVLLGSVVGYGQSFKPVGPSTQTVMTRFSGSDCPVGLRAQRQGEGNVVIVDGSQRYVASPRVHLIFDNWQPNEIVAMTLTVHGYDAMGRISPVGGSEDSAELTKTVNLNLSVASGKKAATDVTLKPLVNVSLVDLESVEYADGTRWSASAGKTCHVAPELFMLVAATGKQESANSSLMWTTRPEPEDVRPAREHVCLFHLVGELVKRHSLRDER